MLIPGLCEGDPQTIAEVWRARRERTEGPARDPATSAAPSSIAHGAWDIEIVAEINAPTDARGDTQRLSISARRRPDRPRVHTPPVPVAGQIVRELVAAGLRVSVDTFDANEIRAGVAAGAELVLSLNGSNIDVARDLQDPARA